MPAPPKYKSAEEMQERIEAYFVQVAEREKQGEKRGIVPTTAGLAGYLGFAGRQSLYDYQNKSNTFTYVLKKAINRIEEYHEERVATAQSCAGSIFWLKNHQWSDQADRNVTLQGGDKPIKVLLETVPADK